MNKLNKNQKIIIVIFASMILAGFYYYTYTKDDFSIEQESMIIENQNNSIETSNETDQNISEKIKVHVVGAVMQEGLVELNQGDRIADAIERAGGLREDACVSEINLAYVLEDGIQIKIPTNEEVAENKISNTQEVLSVVNTNYKLSDASSNTTDKNTKININTATQSEFETLPGIGSATAIKIISYRNENGKFKTIEDIKNVKGIGESKFSSIKDLITI